MQPRKLGGSSLSAPCSSIRVPSSATYGCDQRGTGQAITVCVWTRDDDRYKNNPRRTSLTPPRCHAARGTQKTGASASITHSMRIPLGVLRHPFLSERTGRPQTARPRSLSTLALLPLPIAQLQAHVFSRFPPKRKNFETPDRTRPHYCSTVRHGDVTCQGA